MAIIVFEHENVGVGRLGAALRDYGHKLRILRPADGDVLPPDLDDVDGVISCGGPQSANDADAWITEEIKYLRDAVDAGLPVIGVCLGAQMLAKALGGDVARMPGGIELGWLPITLTPPGRDDIIHTGLPWDMQAFHFHRDEITKLPDGARLIASSKQCKAQTWTYGLRVYAFQWELTATPAMIETWMERDSAALTEASTTIEAMREELAERYDAFVRLTQRLYESIALFLMPVDRMNPGVVKDLLH